MPAPGSEPLRVGIAGSGFIATKKHIPAWQGLGERVALVALADPNAAGAQQVAAQFGIPHTYAGVEEMIEAQHLDIVDVCTPPATHVAVATAATARGCHVLVEKPMAVNVEDCDAIIASAEANGVQVCVGHSDLFYPPFRRARELVAGGAIGEFRGMRVFLSTPTDYMTSKEDHWANRLPGGVIGESGPHVVYLTLPFIPAIESVRVLGRNQLGFPWTPYDDYRIDLVGEHATCSVTSVYSSDQWAAEIHLWGSTGMLTLDLELMTLVEQRRTSLDRWTVARSGLRHSVSVARDLATNGLQVFGKRYKNTHDVLLDRFVTSILDGGSPPVPAGEGREAVRVMGLIVDALAASPEAAARG